ncbi:hypothetical protein FOZ63_009507 [Perkinsus olseni]|nr:hypothetical protein FOZ63_009507 [Perkinsus olseni]
MINKVKSLAAASWPELEGQQLRLYYRDDEGDDCVLLPETWEDALIVSSAGKAGDGEDPQRPVLIKIKISVAEGGNQPTPAVEESPADQNVGKMERRAPPTGPLPVDASGRSSTALAPAKRLRQGYPLWGPKMASTPFGPVGAIQGSSPFAAGCTGKDGERAFGSTEQQQQRSSSGWVMRFALWQATVLDWSTCPPISSPCIQLCAGRWATRTARQQFTDSEK